MKGEWTSVCGGDEANNPGKGYRQVKRRAEREQKTPVWWGAPGGQNQMMQGFISQAMARIAGFILKTVKSH